MSLYRPVETPLQQDCSSPRALPVGPLPTEVVTDRALAYPWVLNEVVRDLGRPRSAQSPATADAPTQPPRLRAHHRGRPCLRTGPAPRPLRDHHSRTSNDRVRTACDELVLRQAPADVTPAATKWRTRGNTANFARMVCKSPCAIRSADAEVSAGLNRPPGRA